MIISQADDIFSNFYIIKYKLFKSYKISKHVSSKLVICF